MTDTWLEILWRRRNLVIGIALLAMVVGFAVLGLRKNLYTASVYFAPRGTYAPAVDALMAVDPKPLLKQIYTDQSLSQWPEFNPTRMADTSVIARLAVKATSMIDPVRTADDLEHRALMRMEHYFTVRSLPAERTVELTYTSTSPRTAANVVNAMAQGYMRQMPDYRFVPSSANEGLDAIRFTHADIYLEPGRPALLPLLSLFILTGLLGGAAASVWADRSYRKAVAS